jgi:hypothetical protein
MATADGRIDALKVKHQQIDDTLQSETSRPLPDDTAIASLKREKLRLKDEINRLTHH